jgi:glycosyltransferase involved in cell wall biosynthesis
VGIDQAVNHGMLAGLADGGRGDVERARSWPAGWGIQDQIRHGHSGLLLEDPSDLIGFGRALQTLLTDCDPAQRMGEAAHRRVCQEYLAPRRLIQELDLIERVAD